MNGKILFCAQKKYIPGPVEFYNKKTRVMCTAQSTREAGRPWATREGRVGVSCTLYPSAGSQSRAGPSIPVVKRKPRGRKASRSFQPRGGVFRESPVLGNMKIILSALCKNGGGSLWMGSKRQIDLYLSNDQTRRHPQRKFRNSRVFCQQMTW